MNRRFAIKNVLPTALFCLLMAIACNKPPYMPDGPATRYEPVRNNDGTYGGNNDGQPLLTKLRIMTYNIHILNPPSKPGETDIQATANAIRRGNPDIVFLQEVDQNTTRNGYNGDQAKDLAQILEMNYTFFSAKAQNRGFYGVAILSKYPIKNAQKYLLTKENDATEQRVMGTAIIDLPGIDSIIAAVSHLQHNSANNRLQQVNDIAAILGAVPHRVVFGADLNEFETTTNFFNVFDGVLTRTCIGGNCPRTFSAQNPQSTIDYLAYKPSTAFSVNAHSTLPEFYASDHLPVLAELTINR